MGDSSGETNFPHKLLLTNTQVSKICKAFKNGSTTNIKFSKTQLSKLAQLGGFLRLEFFTRPPKELLFDSIKKYRI